MIHDYGSRIRGLIGRGRGQALLLILVLMMPIVDRNAYNVDVLVNAGIFMLLALGLNVIVGYAGMLNLGYAALFAVGAYAYGILNTTLGIPFWLGLPLAGLAAAVVGMLLAFPALR
nr:branched-chain amino acid ABC transporter permease [Candidatus Omnitrophota bacterium]